MLFSVRWTTSKRRGGVGGCVTAATPVGVATGDEAGVGDSDDAAGVNWVDVAGVDVAGVDVAGDAVTVPVTGELADAEGVGTGGVGVGGVGVGGVGVGGVGEGAAIEQALVDAPPVVFAERFPAASTASTAME